MNNEISILLAHFMETTADCLIPLTKASYYRHPTYGGTIYRDAVHNAIYSKLKLRLDFELLKDSHISP